MILKFFLLTHSEYAGSYIWRGPRPVLLGISGATSQYYFPGGSVQCPKAEVPCLVYLYLAIVPLTGFAAELKMVPDVALAGVWAVNSILSHDFPIGLCHYAATPDQTLKN